MMEADPRILAAAEHLFIAQGYHTVLLADVAREAGVALPAVQSHFPQKNDLLTALLRKLDPRDEIRQVMRQLEGGNPEEMLRTAIQRLLMILETHAHFTRLALVDTQVNEGAYLTEMFQDLTTDSAGFVNRLSTMSGVRPISTMMLGRALAAFLLGFIATQQLAPPNAQFAIRIFPHKVWVDGLTDILLHGILDD